MIKPTFNSFDNFAKFLTQNMAKPKQIHNQICHIILDNPQIPWSWGKEKLMHLLYFQLSGGSTGSGWGHYVYFTKTLNEGIPEAYNIEDTNSEKLHEYAHVCMIGMYFRMEGDQIKIKTPIQYLNEAVEQKTVCMAHIIAHPEEEYPYFHEQNIIINLQNWKNVGSPSFKKYGGKVQTVVRHEENVHDDYTPYSIEKGEGTKNIRPQKHAEYISALLKNDNKIVNFPEYYRKVKLFSYPNKNYPKFEQELYDYTQNNSSNKKNSLIDGLRVSKQKYYTLNNEILPKNKTKQKYNVIIVPSSGCFAEYYYAAFGAEESCKIVIYDYAKEFLEFKKLSLEMCSSNEDIDMLCCEFREKYPKGIFSSHYAPNSIGSINKNNNFLNRRFEYSEKIQERCEIIYEHVDLIRNDLSWIDPYIKKCNVVVHTSNIFGYHMVHKFNDIKTIYNKQLELEDKLIKNTKKYVLTGTDTFKKRRMLIDGHPTVNGLPQKKITTHTLYKQAKKWCENNNIWYLKCLLKFPKESVQEALQLYDEGYFITHRGGDSGKWKSATLHGTEWYQTMNPNAYGLIDDETTKWKWTEIQEIAPETTRFLKEVFPNNSNYRRCRFMLIEPNGYIQSHTDTGKDHYRKYGLRKKINSAINIAITQPKDCYLRRTDTKEEVPFEPFDIFWYDNGPFHEAKNNSDENRYHFIIHGGDCVERKELFVKSFMDKFPEVDIGELIK